MKRNTLMCIFTAIVLAGLASAESPSLLEQAIEVESDTGADGVLLLHSKKIVLAEDGRVSQKDHQVQRILTDHGLDAYGDPIVSFNSRLHDVKVEKARSLRADGAETEITENAVNVVTPKAVARAPHFADLQDEAVTLLGLELGTATEFEVKVEDVEPYRDIFYGSEPMWDTRDIVKKKVVIKVPKDRDIKWFATGLDIKPAVKKKGKVITYTFTVEDVAAINPNGVDPKDLPTIYWVESVGAPTLAKNILSAATLALDPEHEKGLEQADIILGALESEFSEEPSTPANRAMEYYKRIADGVVTVDVDRQVFGDDVRTPSKAYRSAYADRIEKLGILHTLFTRMGYDPVVLAVVDSDPGKKTRLHPHNVSELWLRVAVEGRYLYLDTSGTSIEGEPRHGEVFVLGPDGAKSAKFIKPATTRMKLDVAVDLTSVSDPRIVGTLTLRGSLNPFWSMHLSGKADPVSVVEGAIGEFASMQVLEATFKRLALDETVVAFSGTPVVVDGRFDTTLPSSLAAAHLDHWQLWRTDRNLPLVNDEKAWEKVRFEIRLPEGGRVLHAPTFADQTESAAIVSIFHSVGLDSDVASLVRRIDLEAGEVAPDELSPFGDVLAQALSRGNNRIVVQLPTPK